MPALLIIFIAWVLGSYAIYRADVSPWFIVLYALASMAAAAWFIYKDNQPKL